MTDKILELFFEPDRWTYAIHKGIGKHINKAHLYQLTKPSTRMAMYAAIRNDKYVIAPPHTALIPKDNGEFRTVPDDDPIFAIIKKKGTIPDRRLFRRWIMAQVFHMLTETDYKSNIPIGFTAALRRKGYKYQWTMVVEEMRVQSKLNLSDPENFAERNRWFNKKVVVEMAQDYISQLKKVVKGLRVRHCKGVPYVRLGNTNIFVTDVQNKVYEQLEKALKAIKNARTPVVLSIATEKYYQLIKKIYLAYGLDQSRAFKDAYKGAGAFFTLKNLILFHDCVFLYMTQEVSLAYLYQLIEPKDFEGYKLFGILKDFLKQNNINIAAKQAEWRAQSSK